MTSEVIIDQTNPRWKQVLDHGHVHLVDFMGSDRRIVDAARVSYQQGTKAVQSDRHLIRYLVKNLHTTPLEKVVFEFHVKLPILTARQWMRHRAGSFNEISARYSVMKDEFYIPSPVRKQSESNRQGSTNEEINWLDMTLHEKFGNPDLVNTREYLQVSNETAYEDYELLLKNNVARELARSVLPVSLYTEFYWTVNLWNLMHFLKLRLDNHAQLEIRVYAEAIFQIIKDNCDLDFALEAFQDYILDDPKISKYELQIMKDTILQLQYDTEKPRAVSYETLKARVQQLIEAHPDMSKREKQESKLTELLFQEENDEIQSDLSKQDPHDTEPR